jgi:ElaB/YqjD/DUF883 family membrane-anchored ribosome-binding protein
MSTKSEVVGKRVINGIDGAESTAHDAVHAGADGARHLTKASARWAARQEAAAARKARILKRRLDKQAVQLSKAAGKTVGAVADTARDAVTTSGRYVRKNPWPAVAIASGAALVLGALLGRRPR